jgi:CBS domain-containing protein
MERKLLVREIMSQDVTTLKRNDELIIADDVMRLGRIRHLPVVDDEDEGKVVGIISQRDLFRTALARTIGYGEFAQSRVMKLLKVKEVMTSDVVSIGPDAPLEEAARIMWKRKLGCLIVMDGDRLAGILTEGDFVKLVAGPG